MKKLKPNKNPPESMAFIRIYLFIYLFIYYNIYIPPVSQ